MGETNVNTISGSAKLIESSGRATIFLSEGTKIIVNNALFSPKSRRNLLSFKDIRENGYHIETNGEFLLITSIISGQKCVVEKLPSFSFGLYYAQISAIEIHHLVDQKSTLPNDFMVWHDRLGHPESIMTRRIIENSHGHSLKNQKK